MLEKEDVILTFFAPLQQFEQVRKDILSQFADFLISASLRERPSIRLVRILMAHCR
jgi:hypothetical protein